MSNPTHYLSADVADLARSLGLRMATSSAVRAAVRDRRIGVSGLTPRGVAIWTQDFATEEVLRLAIQADEQRREAEEERRRRGRAKRRVQARRAEEVA